MWGRPGHGQVQLHGSREQGRPREDLRPRRAGRPSPEPHIRDLEPFTSSPGALRKSSRAAQPSAL